MTEALYSVKLPNTLKVHMPKKGGFTKFNVDGFEDMVAEKWLIGDGCEVKHTSNHGP